MHVSLQQKKKKKADGTRPVINRQLAFFFLVANKDNDSRHCLQLTDDNNRSDAFKDDCGPTFL